MSSAVSSPALVDTTTLQNQLNQVASSQQFAEQAALARSMEQAAIQQQLSHVASSQALAEQAALQVSESLLLLLLPLFGVLESFIFLLVFSRPISVLCAARAREIQQQLSQVAFEPGARRTGGANGAFISLFVGDLKILC